MKDVVEVESIHIYGWAWGGGFILNKISLLGIVLKFFPVFLKPGRAYAGVSMCDVDTQLSSFFKCWAGPVLLDEPGESHCLVAGQGPRDGAA